MRAPHRLLVCLILAAGGCGGASLESAIQGAEWQDERTVILPPGSITFDRLYALREQAAAELSCPVGDVTVADSVEVGGVEVVPVQACGALVYYAELDAGFTLVGRLRPGSDAARVDASSGGAAPGTPTVAGPAAGGIDPDGAGAPESADGADRAAAADTAAADTDTDDTDTDDNAPPSGPGSGSDSIIE